MPDAAAVPGEADRGVSDSTAALYASTVSGGGCMVETFAERVLPRWRL